MVVHVHFYVALSKSTIQIEKLINKIFINQVISPRANTADRGPVTGPIRNNLINNIIIYVRNYVSLRAANSVDIYEKHVPSRHLTSA